MGVIKGDTRSLDYSSCGFKVNPRGAQKEEPPH